MFGLYEIACDGRTWHGNVTLKGHHIVARDGAHSLFRVQEMAALPISAALAEVVRLLLPNPGTLIPDALMQELRGAAWSPKRRARREPRRPRRRVRPQCRPGLWPPWSSSSPRPATCAASTVSGAAASTAGPA